MKSKIILTAIVAVLLVGVIFFVLYTQMHRKPKDVSEDTSEKVYTFNLSDYSWELENCSDIEKNVGIVATREVAVEKAKELWEERFGHIYKLNDLPACVAYDSKNECWLINGTLKDQGINFDGAVPCVIISKDGTVLAIWIG